jgi:hypothetical protein
MSSCAGNASYRLKAFAVFNIWIVGNPTLNIQAFNRAAEDDCWHAVKYSGHQAGAQIYPEKPKPRTYMRGSRRSHPDEGEGLGGPEGPVQPTDAHIPFTFRQKWTVLSSIPVYTALRCDALDCAGCVLRKVG